jgi:alcohol dehydrogenase
MKALVYHGPGQKSWDDKSRPELLKPTDAIVRVTKTTLCGTDLAILRGGVATCQPGTTLGHEGVGIVEEVGAAISTVQPGDPVIISCITSCGRCEYCRRGLYSNCTDGGWMLGNTIDGTQAEYVRVPHADNGLHLIPAGMDDEAALMLSDIIPTGLEVGIMNGDVKFGDTIAIMGAGPVGLAALMAAQFYSPGEIIVVDLDDHRLEKAKSLGATFTINNSDGQAARKILDFTGGKGVDVAIEVVGHPATCEICQSVIGAGGTIADIGVYSKGVELQKHILWTKNITLRLGTVNTTTIPLLMKTIQSGKLDPKQLVSHHFNLSDIIHAYDVFMNAAEEQAIKLVLTNDISNGSYSAITINGAVPETLIEQIVAQVLQKFQ